MASSSSSSSSSSSATRCFQKVAYTGPSEAGRSRPIRYLCRNLREEENQLLTLALKERVRLLRSLSLEIGAEVRHQNRALLPPLLDLERADGDLQKASSRVARVAGGGQHYHVVAALLLLLLAVFACLATASWWWWCVTR